MMKLVLDDSKKKSVHVSTAGTKPESPVGPKASKIKIAGTKTIDVAEKKDLDVTSFEEFQKENNGESIVIFTNQNARIKDDGCLHFPKKCDLKHVKTRIKQFQQVRIIPLGDIYKIEIIHEREAKDLGLNKDAVLSIDLGLNNLITAVNNKGLKPFIIKGGNVKSVNHYYNRQLARYRSIESKKPLMELEFILLFSG